MKFSNQNPTMAFKCFAGMTGRLEKIGWKAVTMVHCCTVKGCKNMTITCPDKIFHKWVSNPITLLPPSCARSSPVLWGWVVNKVPLGSTNENCRCLTGLCLVISSDFSPCWSHSANPAWPSITENGSISSEWHHATCEHQGGRPASNHT